MAISLEDLQTLLLLSLEHTYLYDVKVKQVCSKSLVLQVEDWGTEGVLNPWRILRHLILSCWKFACEVHYVHWQMCTDTAHAQSQSSP